MISSSFNILWNIIKENKQLRVISTKDIRDSHHIFGELYENRIILFYTYHIKLQYWDLFDILELEIAPKYDNYDNEEVLKRILSLKRKSKHKNDNFKL